MDRDDEEEEDAILIVHNQGWKLISLSWVLKRRFCWSRVVRLDLSISESRKPAGAQNPTQPKPARLNEDAENITSR